MSAQPENVLPFPTAKPTLEQAVTAWIEAKRKEDAAKAERLAVEEVICELSPPRPEGSLTVAAGDFKVTLTGSYTYRVEDLEALRNITRDWDSNLVPLRSKTEADPTGCRWLRENRPDLWAQLSQVITVKPAKTSVRVGV